MNEYDKYLFYDKPIPYKNLLIYPAKMMDYLDFHLYVNCLLLDKNSIPDAKVITMSYLNFLYYISKAQNIPYLYMFKELLKMVLHIEDDNVFWFGILSDGKTAAFKINGDIYTSDDFDKIVDIIFLQNNIEHIDDTIQKEIRDAMEAAEIYKMQNTYKMCSLEDQMICVMISTSLDLNQIYNLTIRKFVKILERVDCKLHYKIYLSAQMSGLVEFKNGDAIKHWMADLTKKDKYNDVKVDMEDMQHKIKGINK